jgi:hypothetical protein
MKPLCMHSMGNRARIYTRVIMSILLIIAAVVDDFIPSESWHHFLVLLVELVGLVVLAGEH